MNFETLVNEAIAALEDASRYHCYRGISPEEVDRVKAALIACHARGETLLPPVGDDPFAGILPDMRPQASPEEEAAAVAAQIAPLSLPGVIAAYHRQISRESAVAIVSGAQALANTPGASWIIGPLEVFPGYRADATKFAQDWSTANPAQKTINTEPANPIAKRRKAAGMTQTAFAAALGTDQRAISRWESGAFKPRSDTLAKMAQVLDCSIENLL
ncbi:MAG: helix-turn-helix transcriptional regulator [Oscillospiraceae bacterium]